MVAVRLQFPAELRRQRPSPGSPAAPSSDSRSMEAEAGTSSSSSGVVGARIAASGGDTSGRTAPPADAVFSALRRALAEPVGSVRRRDDMTALSRRVKSALQYAGAQGLLRADRAAALVADLSTAWATAEPDDGGPWDAAQVVALVDGTEWLAWRLAYWWFVDARVPW